VSTFRWNAATFLPFCSVWHFVRRECFWKYEWIVISHYSYLCFIVYCAVIILWHLRLHPRRT